MAERPILFSGPLVRAILDGRKTVTRRPVDMRRIGFVGGAGQRDDPAAWGFEMDDGGFALLARDVGQNTLDRSIPCPFGDAGDRLWVRETWQAWKQTSYEYDEYDVCDSIPKEDDRSRVTVEYGATSRSRGPWRPSIHMPRWASRLTLDVVSVRVERVQSITVADACAEGAGELLGPGHPMHGRVYEERGVWTGNERLDRDGPFAGAVEAFAVSWDSIYSGAQSWDANPWVWRVEFKIAEVRHAL